MGSLFKTSTGPASAFMPSIAVDHARCEMAAESVPTDAAESINFAAEQRDA
ncbi:MAG: hypothetical protein NTX48_21650 [Planctomycetales bacterium]|jgi:hypothetical protein|nr:hypothetical protein [Planctomycetales bacterium]